MLKVQKFDLINLWTRRTTIMTFWSELFDELLKTYQSLEDLVEGGILKQLTAALLEQFKQATLEMIEFTSISPTLEDYWRSIILFGHNSATYRFALAKSLLELAPSGKSFITWEELARPFSRHITEHLQQCDKQGSSSFSQFVQSCRAFNGSASDKRGINRMGRVS